MKVAQYPQMLDWQQILTMMFAAGKPFIRTCAGITDQSTVCSDDQANDQLLPLFVSTRASSGITM
jgi:hypothetical protein